MRRALGYVWGTAIVIALWQLLAVCVDSPALPTPLATVPDIAENLDVIAPQFGVSLVRLLAAMAIGTVLGAPLGLLLGRSARASAVLDPVVYVLYPLPKIVILPVLFVLFGIGGQAKVILIAIAVFFQMLVTMRDAARSVPEAAVVALRSLGATRAQVFREAVVPATLSDLFTALRVSTGTAVAILFIAESMAGSTGLGYFIMHAWSLLEYTQMFAGIVAMAVMGVVLYEAFDFAERRLSHA